MQMLAPILLDTNDRINCLCNTARDTLFCFFELLSFEYIDLPKATLIIRQIWIFIIFFLNVIYIYFTDGLYQTDWDYVQW